MHFIRFYILFIAVIISVPARRNRKVAPRGCSFDGKKKQDKACNPFWKIKQPNCHASNAHRIKRTECSKKFCWKIVDNKTRKGNNNIPSEDSFLVIQAKQAKSNQQAVAQFESQPFRIIPKKNTKCFSFRHLMRAKAKTNSGEIGDSMVVRLKLIQTRKNNPSEWVIWERSEADAKHWLEHEVNLYDEITRLMKQTKGKKSTRRKFTKANYKLQFEASHSEASKDAIIAIDDLKFFNNCKSTIRKTRPSGKPQRTSAPPTTTPKVNDEVISIFPKMPNVRPLTGQRYEHLFAPKHYQGRKAGQAAYRPRDSVMDMSNKQEVASPSIYQYYDERSSVESPDEYYEYRNHGSRHQCTYNDYALDIGDCIKGFRAAEDQNRSSRRKMTCSDKYNEMVHCMKDVAVVCAMSINSNSDEDRSRLEDGIERLLNDELNLKKSYCDVDNKSFPKFDILKYGMNCEADARDGLSKCVEDFSQDFTSPNDNLCSKYTVASKCKRDVIGKQCKFKTVENMLIFGVGNEVQNFYNPFCDN